jgi:hypothetical protein
MKKLTTTKQYAISAFLLLSFTAYFTTTNNDTLQKIVTKLEQYTIKTPQEKVYLHFDKPYYMAGETIWYAGYLFDAINHGIDSVSTVLYVDLIDPSVGKVLQSGTMKCQSGMTQGSFTLPDNLPQGTYQVRAYTNYMRNYDDSYFFKRDIKIWQSKPNKATDTEYEQLAKVADLQFFPEGGYLVSDVDCRVAFKAVNVAGHGIEAEGAIMENDTGLVCAFKAENLGMGMVNFIPKAGKIYTAKLKTAVFDTKMATIALPQVQAVGYVLAVDNVSNKDFVRVVVINNTPKEAANAKSVTLLGHQRGRFCFGSAISEAKKTSIIRIPRSGIPDDGLVHLTLFDPDGKPLCERLIFAQQNKQINLKVTADKAMYKPREKVTLTVEATDTLGKPVEGAFSIAATDGSQVITTGNEQNIYTHLLMTSDLKGYIEEPASYFKKTDTKSLRALDILMMTQGWRRFDWANVVADKYPTLKYPIEQGLTIKGQVSRPNGKISKNVSVTLMVKSFDSKSPFLALATADSLGNFMFPNLNIQDSAQILVQAVKEKGGRNLNIRLNTEGGVSAQANQSAYKNLDFDATALSDFLKKTGDKLAFERKLKLNKEQMLKEVEITAKRKEPEDSRRALYGRPSKSIDMTGDNCTRYATIYNAIEFNVPNVRTSFSPDDMTTSISIRGSSNVTFLVDGIATDKAFIDALNPCDIEAIDVLRGAEATALVSGGGDAAISILTRRGNSNYNYGNEEAVGIITKKYTGYNSPAEFYAPKYDVRIAEHEFTDFRATLHWQPMVKTDATGKATVSFWATDAVTSVKVVAEGRSNKGRVGVGTAQFEIKK